MRFRGLGLPHRLCPAFGLAVGLGLVVGMSPIAPAKAASTAVPRFEPAPCPDFPVPELAKARCGYLVVPENRAKRNGRTIRLIVATIPAASPSPKADPVVYLTGGPGGIALLDIPLVLRTGVNQNRDLVARSEEH